MKLFGRTKKSLLLTLIALFGIFLTAFAVPKEKQSYNLTRALEELNKGNEEEALEFLQKEVIDNPNNGEAHMAISILQTEAENYSEAMTSVNLAIKKLPKKEKENIGKAYVLRAKLYAIAGDTVAALTDLNQGIRINPDDEDLQGALGQMLYELKRYDEADAAYRKIIEINPAGVTGYMGLGRDAYARDDYEEAIRQYDAVLKMYEDYSSGYAFRAESYLKLGRYLDAINDLTSALAIDNDPKAHHYLFEFPDDQTTLVITKLKGMAAKNPLDAEWWFYMAQLYKDKKKYAEAIDALQKAYDIDAYPGFLETISDCYQELGDYAKALEYVNQALNINPDDMNLISSKADILGESGDVEGAIAEYTGYIERAPDFFGGYYRRGFFEDNSGRTDEALEDYNMAIMLQPDFAYAYMGKGDMLLHKGLTEEAMEAYRKVVELDTVPNSDSCAMYALLALGEKDKAIDFMNRVIESDSTDSGVYYDAACFYSRLGDMDKALANLRTSFEKGFRRFHHVRADDDLETLRQTDAFKTLIEEYESKAEQELTPASSETQQETPAFSETQKLSERVEVPFTPDSGCVSVKCTINELPLNFIFDTGASIVSLSQVEANFMLKNGYLKREDFVGSGKFVDANGNVSEGSVVNLRNVDFGGLKLNNVRASVVRNQKAPLLLGQSVLGRLGSIEIDNPGKKIIITQSKR